MATNPRIPEERDAHPKIEQQLQPVSRVPWVWVAIIAAGAILLALIIWLPRTPRASSPSGAQVPQQPTGQQVQFRDVKLTPAPSGGSAYLDANLVNAGSTAINGVLVEVAFKGSDGRTLETVRRPVEGVVGGTNTTTQNLTDAPIKPGEGRHVRIALDRVPQGGDQQIPAVSVIAVTGVGNASDNKLNPPILNKGQNATPSGSKPEGSATEPTGSNAKSGGKPQQ